ncbi:MAG: hypothetical protein M3Y59_05675, partial [Myxococcota bacterium]|nr:hypothetical protein [Myxococcota bacterium]
IAERRMRSLGMGPSRAQELPRERLPAPRPPEPRATGEVTAPLPRKQAGAPVDRPQTSPATTRPPALRRTPSSKEPAGGPAGTHVARPPRVSGQHPAAKPRGRGGDDER